MYFDRQADRSGGVAAPSVDVEGLSRVRGPVRDAQTEGPMYTEGGQFNPGRHFNMVRQAVFVLPGGAGHVVMAAFDDLPHGMRGTSWRVPAVSWCGPAGKTSKRGRPAARRPLKCPGEGCISSASRPVTLQRNDPAQDAKAPDGERRAEQIGAGLRVYMNRGWFSSGQGVQLALVVAVPETPWALMPDVSAWELNPLHDTAPLPRPLQLEHIWGGAERNASTPGPGPLPVPRHRGLSPLAHRAGRFRAPGGALAPGFRACRAAEKSLYEKGIPQAGSWMWAEMRRSMRRKTNSTP